MWVTRTWSWPQWQINHQQLSPLHLWQLVQWLTRLWKAQKVLRLTKTRLKKEQTQKIKKKVKKQRSLVVAVITPLLRGVQTASVKQHPLPQLNLGAIMDPIRSAPIASTRMLAWLLTVSILLSMDSLLPTRESVPNHTPVTRDVRIVPFHKIKGIRLTTTASSIHRTQQVVASAVSPSQSFLSDRLSVTSTTSRSWTLRSFKSLSIIGVAAPAWSNARAIFMATFQRTQTTL